MTDDLSYYSLDDKGAGHVLSAQKADNTGTYLHVCLAKFSPSLHFG